MCCVSEFDICKIFKKCFPYNLFVPDLDLCIKKTIIKKKNTNKTRADYLTFMSEQMGGSWPRFSAYSQKSDYARLISDRIITPDSS